MTRKERIDLVKADRWREVLATLPGWEDLILETLRHSVNDMETGKIARLATFDLDDAS